MAVVREQRQFKIGTIGVNRPSRAGQMVGQAIADSAAQLEGTFFNMAVDEAKQRGIESAQAIAREDIVALDENGRPKAYKIPKLIGKYEREAYNAVLMQRFETEINLDLQKRSNELAIQFRRSPEAYKKAMSDHVAAMANTEESTVYTNYINTLGTGLAQQQYRGLQLQAIQRQEADDRQAYSNSVTDNLRAIEDTAAVDGDVSELMKGGAALDAINTRSGTVLPSSTANNARNRELAHVRGTLRLDVRKALENSQTTKEELALALSAIDLNDPSRLPDSFSGTRELLAGRGPSFAQEIAEFGVELLNDSVVQKDLDNQRLIRERQMAGLQTEAELDASLGSLLTGTSDDLIAKLDQIITDYTNDQQTYRTEMLRGVDEAVAASGAIESTQRMTVVSGAMIKKAVMTADTKEDLVNLQTYLKAPTETNLSRLDDDTATLAQGLIQIAQVTGTEVLDLADSFAESASDEIAFKENQRKIKGALNFEDDIDDVLSAAFKAQTIEDLEKVARSGGSSSDYEMDLQDKDRLFKKLDNGLGANYLRLAFSQAKTERINSAMTSYVRTATDKEGLLTEEQRKLLDKGRTLIKDPSTLTTSLNTYSLNAENDRKRRAQMISDQRFTNDVQSGVMNGSDEKNRERLDTLYGVTPQFYLDQEFADKNPGLGMALAQAAGTIWPQAQLEAINSFLAGNVTDDSQVERLLTTFAQASTFVTANGQSMRSKGSEAMDSDDFALMSELASYAEAGNSPAQVLQHMNALQRMQQDSDLQKKKQDFFTVKVQEGKKTMTVADSVSEYVLYNYPRAVGNTNLRNRLVALANATYFSNVSDTSRGIKEVKKVLDAEFKQAFVEDDRIIAEDGTSNTMYPLDITTGGNADLFVSYVKNQMIKNRVDDTLLKRIDQDDDGFEYFETVDFKLVPVGFNSQDRGMTYGVVIVDKETGERSMQDVRISPDPRDEDAEDFGVVPAFFSTNEPEFARIKASINQAVTDAEIAEAERRYQSSEAARERFNLPVETPAERSDIKAEAEGEEPAAVQSTVAQFIDTEKYAPLFDKLPSSVGVNYGKLTEASPTSIRRILKQILDATSPLEDQLAEELQADLLEMIRSLQ